VPYADEKVEGRAKTDEEEARAEAQIAKLDSLIM